MSLDLTLNLKFNKQPWYCFARRTFMFCRRRWNIIFRASSIKSNPFLSRYQFFQAYLMHWTIQPNCCGQGNFARQWAPFLLLEWITMFWRAEALTCSYVGSWRAHHIPPVSAIRERAGSVWKVVTEFSVDTAWLGRAKSSTETKLRRIVWW